MLVPSRHEATAVSRGQSKPRIKLAMRRQSKSQLRCSLGELAITGNYKTANFSSVSLSLQAGKLATGQAFHAWRRVATKGIRQRSRTAHAESIDFFDLDWVPERDGKSQSWKGFRFGVVGLH